MHKTIAVILSTMVFLSLIYPTTTLANERPRNRDEFQKKIGDRFNGSTASFAGFETPSLKGFFVAGSPEDDYSAHFIFSSNSTLATFIDSPNGSISQIQIMQVIFLSFPKAIFLNFGRVGESERAVIPFSNLNWTIITDKIKVGADVTYSVKLSAALDETPISMRNVTIAINMQLKKELRTQPIFEIVANERGDSYSIREKQVFGEGISITMKMDHEFHGLQNGRFKTIVLPIQLRVHQRTVIPKKIFDMNYRPADFVTTENADNESSRPEVRISASNHGASNYSWVPFVSVDGIDFPVRVQNSDSRRISRKGLINSTHVLFVRDWSILKGLIYPYGSNVIHDPNFAVSIFQPIEDVVSLNPSIQVFSLLITIPFFVIVLFILGNRKKYP